MKDKERGQHIASVSFSDVTKIFPGNNLALSSFNLNVVDGEFIVLVGPSGCGKSTILRILSGLEEPSSGRVTINGEDVTDLEPGRRDVAMVFQNYALYPHMTVFDNMSFSLRMKKVQKSEINRLVKETATILGMEDLLGRKPRELSGGQRQRVAVGRAIVRHPAVFLFDEPLSNLDAKLRVQMRSELSLLHNRLESTMIYVTHDQAEAMTLGDRIVVLKDGVVQQIAKPLELYDKPTNRFVAGFIGSPAMNFLKVRIHKDQLFFGENSIIRINRNVMDGSYEFGVRPEDIHHSSGSEWKGIVKIVETLGNEKIIYFSFGNEMLVARCQPDIQVESGGEFPFSVNLNRTHLFSEDGIRISLL